jgi:hypothetical protein
MEKEMKKILYFTVLSLMFSPSLFANPIKCPEPDVVQEAFQKALTAKIAEDVALESTKNLEVKVWSEGFHKIPPTDFLQTGTENIAQCFYYNKKEGPSNYFYYIKIQKE